MVAMSSERVKEVINEVQVQEWLAKNYHQNKNEFYDFYLLINGEQAAENRPTLFVNLMWDPNQENHKLMDAQALAIWDAFINTIRYRNPSS
ncbi:MAG: T6SS immunity protein Tli4 family protein [Acinetobacter sp.]